VETIGKKYRIRFGVRALIAFVAVCAVLFWALRFSRDSRPAYLYAAWLNGGDESRRVHAAHELGGEDSEGSPVVVSLIRALLTDRAIAVRKESALSLGRVVSKLQDGATTSMAAGGLVQALVDKDPGVRTAVADALGRIAPQPDVAVPALLHAADDESEWVRGASIAALGLIQMKARVDRTDVRLAIAAAMTDPSLHVRELGMYAFWATAENSPALSLALLTDRDVQVRRAAASALARSGPLAEKVASDLAKSLKDPDAVVRDGAERALLNMGIAVTSE
jgi:HEAT repeat protein